MSGRERVVPLHLYLLVGVSIYKQLPTCHSTVLVEVKESLIESVEWAPSIEKEARKEEDWRDLPSSGVLKSRLRQSLSDTCGARKGTV